jgi:bifunctional UDP-N-acetylglucosamine pyrophosphorylase/glucosamine-1-phosphate N-acetyltransferase
LVEKPESMSDTHGYRLLSTYLLTTDFLHELENTAEDHYQFEAAISQYSSTHEVRSVIIESESFSLKYPWDLFDLRDALWEQLPKQTAPSAKISDTAKIGENVFIGENVTIMEYAVIKGPCFIGDNSIIGDFALLRNGCVIEDNCVVSAHSQIKNSLMESGSHVHGYIGDSIIGKDARLGGGFLTSNVRLDRNEISVTTHDKKVNSGRKSLGAIIGDRVNIGTNTSTMPGILIGSNAAIGPSTMVKENVENDSLVYTEFSYIKKSSKT